MASTLQNLYLVVSQRCNLACTYCYAGGGDFGQAEQLMDRKTLYCALDLALPRAADSLVVSFFGGEPFLNFERMQEAVEYGNRLAAEQGKDIQYALTTNGTLATDEMVRFIKEHVSYLAVSLDGDLAGNDEERRFRGGNRSVHDAVLRTIGRLREEGIPFALRATVAERNASKVRQTAKYLSGLGAVSVRLVPAFYQDGWTSAKLERLTDGLFALDASALSKVAHGEPPVSGQYFHKALAGTVGREKWRHPCSAGEAIVAIAANGDIYPCDHFIGFPDYCLGNVHGTGWPDGALARVQAELCRNSVDARPECRCCNVRYLCGGECHALGLMGQGDIATPGASHCAVARTVYSRLTGEIARLVKDEQAMGNIQDYLR